MVKTLDGLLVKNTFPYPLEPELLDGKVFLTSTFPAKEMGLVLCQPVYELITVVVVGEPKFSERMVDCDNVNCDSNTTKNNKKFFIYDLLIISIKSI
jgi:hypothetical protein